ncbi:SAM-dependent chlorinase/fluorinase [Terasakiella sp. SH-1]|uniref:SAM hydrolase/SAM-dependent halogenase family protein n=1 Tax=Terasakiella sp. SH-1 TaxID=2560057 RepID=UPI0010737381|nr:SAM-dependent chlorinase/fluorinase [Terasakiella sp. SH-1]
MIVTFTDFGVTGPYLGQMKARILEYNPASSIIDLMVDVPAFNIEAASLLLDGLICEMPQGCVYLCVVDPGVGGSRKPICLKCDECWFVGPDNGIFTSILARYADVEAYEILWRPDALSHSFHGRDLFAPVAAMLSKGQDFPRQQLEISELKKNIIKDKIVNIIYIDVYGNCWTSLREGDFPKERVLRVQGHRIAYADVFCQTQPGEAFWYYNSSGFVEIAVNQGNAARHFGLEIGNLMDVT